ncbi:hypothetical protein [Fusobacterium sp. FSA-380-WT-2B]|uniref:hypothetical protein n=1 Tax=Fusobacterium sp. FSA-380-WT-2B TaxID=2605786 RepID=UPI0012B3854D|nr:hypothetical protein [Fusobacterium sp. FSA-380-WT-2B]MSS61512.1 hypothetical protein [Fusobacterium sp. FSA-380-WT-2B]
MLEIFKISVSELYRKSFRVVIIFLLNLTIVFGINKFDIKVETFTIFVPAILGILFIEEWKGRRGKDIAINSLIYIAIFSLNALLLYNQIESLDREEILSDSQILFFNLKTVSTDIIIVSIFVMGFLYSLVKDLECRVAVIDMFRYFKEKASRILVLFYGVIFSFYISILIFYGLNTDVCHDFLNLFFLFFVTIFICFLMLVFKNFLISDRKDEVTYRLREKPLDFYAKYLLIIIAIVTGAGIILSAYIMLVSFMGEKSVIFLIIGAIITLLLVVIVEILILNMLIKINGRVQPKAINFKKFLNILIINIIGLVFIGIGIFIAYTIIKDIFIGNPLELYILFAIIISFIGLIINFQVLGVLVDIPFALALKDGFSLTTKFLNPKVLLILIGEIIFLMISILNGSFTGLMYFINLIISFYLIEFYLDEKEVLNETCRSIKY